jgi:hypothetical protein
VTAPKSPRPRHALALLSLLGLGALLYGLRGTPALEAPAPAPGVVRPRAVRAQARATPPAAAPPAEKPPAPNAAPRLTLAALDRTHLCPGESTFLRMSAEDPDDVDLRYQVTYVSGVLGAPRFGFGRWVRFQAPERAGRYGVIAVVEDPGRARDERPLELVVDDCGDAPRPFDSSALRIQHTELDAVTHEFDLSDARARARAAGKTLEVSSWSFGDGATAAGALVARHQYPLVMDRRYSYYLVRADVQLDGAPERIEYGLSFYSYAAANLQAGYVALAADVERGDDAAREISYVVTFSNVTPLSAWAREMELECLDAAGLPREKWREPLDLTVPGDTSLEQTLELDRERCPGGASYELFGEAEGGYAVGGLWSYKLRPSAASTDVREARERARRVWSAPAALSGRAD